MNMKKILIIEDDPGVVESLIFALESAVPSVDIVSSNNGQGGIELVETFHPDVVVLDLGLPDTDGLQVIKDIRFFSPVPILVLTCRGEETDVVNCLTMGANDYLTKPPRQNELIARLTALTRGTQTEFIKFDKIELNISKRTLLFEGREIHLSIIESQILLELLKNAPSAVTYDHLSERIWGEEAENNIGKLKVHINHLRRKMDEIGLKDPIHNVSGLGYLFKPV
jgi:DNA-binding response OmpR family regulator